MSTIVRPLTAAVLEVDAPRPRACDVPVVPKLELSVVRRALELARRSPSAHNTQPWLVEVEPQRVLVSADPSRHLTHGDPMKRDMRLGLGAFAESLRIGLAVEGVGSELDPLEDGFAILPGNAVGADPFAASLIRQRQSSRLPMSPRPVEKEARVSLEKAATQHGLRFHVVERQSADRAQVDDWFFAAARETWLDLRATRELRRWIRFDPEGQRAPEDGLSTHCLGLSAASGAAMMLLMRDAVWKLAGAAFAAPLLAETLAREELASVRAAPAIGFLLGPSAGSGGPGLLRFWLEATRLHLAVHPISALLDRRGWEVSRGLGVDARHVLFAFKLGRTVPPPRSQRRPVASFTRLAVAAAERASASAGR